MESLCLAATPQGVEVVGFKVDSLKKYEGKRLPDIGEAWGKDWADALIDLTLAREEPARAGDLRRVGFERRDAGPPAVDEVRHRRRGVRSGDSAKIATHPRAYGTYPRILGRFVREQHLLTLEDAVRKMTSRRRRAAVDSRPRRAARGDLRRHHDLRSEHDHRSRRRTRRRTSFPKG